MLERTHSAVPPAPLRRPCRPRRPTCSFAAARTRIRRIHIPRAPRCPHRPTRLPITRRKARTNCPRPHPPCTHRPRRPTPSPRTTHTCSPSHRPCPHPSVSPLKLWDCDFPVSLQSISNFVVSLPNLSKRCEGATVPAVAANGRRISASRNWESISNFVVSLPNVSKKDVKGLLFRKQPRTGVCFRLSEIGKAFQTLWSAFRT